MNAERLKRGQQDTLPEKVIPLLGNYKTDSVSEFVEDWKEDFIQRMRQLSKSKKRNFNFHDAEGCTSLIDSPFDKLMIRYVKYVKKNPLKQNDYFKYTESYFQGKELDIKYFRHDVKKLEEYYSKIDKEREKAEKEDRKPFNVFSRSNWERYVLFMMLKLEGLYSGSFDSMFHVKQEGSREYNPLTNMPSVLRQSLPFKIKEFDIKQANPTFLFIQLEIKPFDVYSKIDKKHFNMLLNVHKDIKGYSLIKAQNELSEVYGSRADEVMTGERFNSRGKMFDDLSAIEKEYIEKFVEANELKKYVRLHDSVTVKADVKCENLEFGIVRFREKIWEKPQPQTEIINFYDDDFDTEPARYRKFFEQEGFIRLTEQGKDELTIIKNENKIVKPFNHETDTFHFLRSQINEFDTSFMENIIAGDAYHIRAGFKLMQGKPLRLQRDTKNEVFIPFKNGVAKITKDDVQMIPYSDENIGFFMENESLKYSFKYDEKEATKSVFKDFLFRAVTGRNLSDDVNDLSNEERDNIIAFCSMIGYLISNYKNPSKTYLIILSDYGADNNSRKGGRGKSLIQKAIQKVRVSLPKQGDSFDVKYRHKFADLEIKHDVFILDDVPPNFNYNAFYSEITGGITPERKGTKAEQIPFAWSPKFVISTNFAVRYDKEDDSTNRRFREFQFSNHWNINNKPNEVYNQNFFTDWKEAEWNQFYCFIAECVQTFLSYGVKQIKYDKRSDNYRAYFPNEIKENEIKRILSILEGRNPEGFNVTDFDEVYKEGQYRFDNLFNRHNLKKHIEVYAEYHDLKLEYVQRDRKWRFTNESKDPF